MDLTGYDAAFPPEALQSLLVMIDSRMVSARDLASRHQPILNHYKVAAADELLAGLIACLHALSDDHKRQIIAALSGTISR